MLCFLAHSLGMLLFDAQKHSPKWPNSNSIVRFLYKACSLFAHLQMAHASCFAGQDLS